MVLLAGAVVGGLGCQRRRTPDEIRGENAEFDLSRLQETIPEFTHPLTRREVIDLVLNNNLDAAVRQQEAAIEVEGRTGAKRKLLPSLLLTAERSRRTELDASVSKTLQGNIKSNDPSFSETKNKTTVDVGLAWNLLDFGMSYFRMRQAGARAEAAAQRWRRARQNLALQASTAYWQAQVNRRAMRQAADLIGDVEERARVVRRQVEQKMENRQAGLQVETRMLEAQVRLRRYEKEYHASMAQLASLMGLPVGVPFELAEESLDALPEITEPAYDELERLALEQRPELFEQDLDERIAADEARVALVSMFPNANLFGRHSYDRNPFLLENNWYTVGLNASLDLLSLPQKFSRRRLAKMQTELARRKRLALAVAVIAQVHLAGIEYVDGADEYRLLAALAEKRREMLDEVRKAEAAGPAKGEEVLDAEIQSFLAETRRLEGLARLKVAEARLHNTVGRDWALAPDANETTGAEVNVGVSVNPLHTDTTDESAQVEISSAETDRARVGKAVVYAAPLDTDNAAPDRADNAEVISTVEAPVARVSPGNDSMESIERSVAAASAPREGVQIDPVLIREPLQQAAPIQDAELAVRAVLVNAESSAAPDSLPQLNERAEAAYAGVAGVSSAAAEDEVPPVPSAETQTISEAQAVPKPVLDALEQLERRKAWTKAKASEAQSTTVDPRELAWSSASSMPVPVDRVIRAREEARPRSMDQAPTPPAVSSAELKAGHGRIEPTRAVSAAQAKPASVRSVQSLQAEPESPVSAPSPVAAPAPPPVAAEKPSEISVPNGALTVDEFDSMDDDVIVPAPMPPEEFSAEERRYGR